MTNKHKTFEINEAPFTINDVKAQNRIKIMKKIRNFLKHPPFKKIIILQKVYKKEEEERTIYLQIINVLI